MRKRGGSFKFNLLIRSFVNEPRAMKWPGLFLIISHPRARHRRCAFINGGLRTRGRICFSSAIYALLGVSRYRQGYSLILVLARVNVRCDRGTKRERGGKGRGKGREKRASPQDNRREAVARYDVLPPSEHQQKLSATCIARYSSLAG